MMYVLTKIVQIINFLLFVFVTLALSIYAGAILGGIATSLGILIILFPVMIGFILTIIQLVKSRRKQLKLTNLDKFLAVFPIINSFAILLLILASN